MTVNKKVFVVFGATGNQGGSVVRSILGDPNTAEQFTVRAVTRDLSKPSAQALATLGAELVSADLEDKESLRVAMRGADTVFLVTDFWAKLSFELEVTQGINAANVAKELNVKHLIWSSLLNVTELTNGKYTKVLHFDAKAKIEDHIRSLGILATFFLAGFYMSNLYGPLMCKFNPKEKTINFTLPFPLDTPLPLIDTASDTGKFVKGIVLNKEKTLGKRILGATAYYTPTQIVNDFKAFKPEAAKTTTLTELKQDQFRHNLSFSGMPDYIQEDLVEAMAFMPEFGYFGKKSLAESHAILSEPLTTWKEFVAAAPEWASLN